MVVQLFVLARSQNSYDVAALKFRASAIKRGKELLPIAQRHARFGRRLVNVEGLGVSARKLDEALHAAPILERGIVELQAPQDALSPAAARLPPSTAGAFEGIEHEVDANLWRTRPP